MTLSDEELTLYAIREEQLILADYIQLRPRDSEKTIDALLSVIDRDDRPARGQHRYAVILKRSRLEIARSLSPCHLRKATKKLLVTLGVVVPQMIGKHFQKPGPLAYDRKHRIFGNACYAGLAHGDRRSDAGYPAVETRCAEKLSFRRSSKGKGDTAVSNGKLDTPLLHEIDTFC